MATYLYECSGCGEFETEQAMSAAPLTQCPDCGKEVRRLIAGGTGAIMKGGAAALPPCAEAGGGSCFGGGPCNGGACGL